MGALATALAVYRRRWLAIFRRPRAALLAGTAALLFVAAAGILYLALARRHAAPATVASTASSTSGGQAAQSMQEAVAGLEARLARGGGTDEDWELLAKAYEFLGRPEDAQRARAHQSGAAPGLAAGAAPGAISVAALMAAADGVSSSRTSPTPAPPADARPSSPPPTATREELEQRVHDHPRDASAWLALADLARARHDDRAARAALEKVIALHGMSAQSWADYADVLASESGGSLGGAAGTAIDQALALDPANSKALWLKASQSHEQHRFADALSWWKKLRAVLPADSPDGRIIDGNIAEDTELLGQNPPAAAAVAGTVSIDGRLAPRVQPDATLFIYAKAADSPGPPLAVLRTTAATWPVSFRLDDSMAMLPTRRLSQFDKVVVEARISRSGQATPGSGDLYVTSKVVSPGAATPLALVIDREVD